MKTLPSALAGLALLGASYALAQASQTIFVNGVGLQATTSTKNGETYYQFKASDLKRIGAITAGGVTPKTDAIKGCVGDTLFNGVYSVQLIKAGKSEGYGDKFGVTLKVSNASKQSLYSYLIFSSYDVVVATGSSTAPLANQRSKTFDELLPGTAVTLKTESDDGVAATKWTRLLIRPNANSIEELQKAKLPLAKVYNMEFDLTCTKK